tara:strand:+ start:166 stop:345 length:180 start_codon:yes stop_codon:yes gene_type:complete
MLNEGNKKVMKAIIIPNEVKDKLLMLKGSSSSSLSKSLSDEQREDSLLNLLFVKSCDFV